MPEDLMAALRRSLEDASQRTRTVHERVACPVCGAGLGERCRSRGRRLALSHVERLREDARQS